MNKKAIPQSVLEVLSHLWNEADPNYSSFEAVFNNSYDKKRSSDPSYYHIHAGKKIETDIDVLSNEEAINLVKDGVFGEFAKVRSDKSVTINEHAQHALIDFCSEVYTAWAKYQGRIVQIERSCPPVI